MTDLTERLRALRAGDDPAVAVEAADEIERLRAELAAAEREGVVKNLVIDLGRWRVRFGRNAWRDLGEREGWQGYGWRYLLGERVALCHLRFRRWGAWWL